MASFRFKTKADPLVKEFCDEVKERLFNSDIIKSPFKGGVVLRDKGETYEGYVKIVPQYPALELFWFFVSAAIMVFTGFKFGFWFALFFGLGLFFSLFKLGLFYFVLFFFGLRKKGYQGFIRLVYHKSKGEADFIGAD